VRDQGCVWPGCDRPASFTSGHHLAHWIHGGPTDLSNLVLLWGLLPKGSLEASMPGFGGLS
jgi:HNH endonuclease